MTTKTTKYPPGVIVVPEGASREQWLAERAEGVTASRARAIAAGGLSTWKRELEQQLNGATFRGTAATRAGSAREAALLDEAAELFGAKPNSALWASAENPRIRATPDGIGQDETGERFVVEVKSHEHGWDREDVPEEHMAQIQMQMYVCGASYAWYGFEVRDTDDMPPEDGATWIRVERDEEYIEWLVYRAEKFLAWRDAGCPEVDDLPENVAEVLATWTPLKAQLDALAKQEKEAAAALKKAVLTMPYAKRFGAVGMGEQGGFQLSPSTAISIDEDAYAAKYPEEYKALQHMRTDLALAEASVKAEFPKQTARLTLRFQPAPTTAEEASK